MEGKIGALTAQGKLQAVVVGMLPLALLLVLDRMEPEAMGFLWRSPPGWATLAVIATLRGARRAADPAHRGDRRMSYALACARRRTVAAVACSPVSERPASSPRWYNVSAVH